MAILTIGLPGCGKTTWAKEYVAHAFNEGKQVHRINNDDIREELNGGTFDHATWTPKFENKVRKLRFERMTEALKAGEDIIVDNTHLNTKTLANLKTWLKQNFPHVIVEEKNFCDVPLQVCLDRNAARVARGERGTTPEVIHKMAKEAGLLFLTPPYPIDWELPWTIICDLDGTLARIGKRSVYDCSQCDLLDTPNLHVLNLLRTYQDAATLTNSKVGYLSYGYPHVSKIHFFSGRTDNYKVPTTNFLLKTCGFDVVNDPYFEMVMRKTGDSRHDEIIKKEMFDFHIKNKYNVFVIVDDRPRVVRMWHSLGLPVFNVGDGTEF
jgi:predicted kinase